jgi:hypothetical protein
MPILWAAYPFARRKDNRQNRLVYQSPHPGDMKKTSGFPKVPWLGKACYFVLAPIAEMYIFGGAGGWRRESVAALPGCSSLI